MPQGKPVFFQIHTIQWFCTLQADRVGALLVKLEEIETVLIEKRKMGGNDCLGKVDFPLFGNGEVGRQLKHRCIFVDCHIRGKPGKEFQWVELGLIRKADSSRCGKGQRKLLTKYRGISQFFQGCKLCFQLLHSGTGVNGMVDPGKIAVDFFCQGCKCRNCGKIRLKVGLSALCAESSEQLVKAQSVLCGDFSCGIAGGSPGQSVLFDHNAAYTGFLKRVGTAQAGHASANDQYVRMDIPPQRGKVRKLRVLPDRFHNGLLLWDESLKRLHTSIPGPKLSDS